MMQRLGPLDVECDAPPYAIVRACRRIGVYDPEDVRWCRLSRRARPRASWWEVFYHHPFKFLMGLGQIHNGECLCRQIIPRLGEHTFTYCTGEEETYLIGQCPCCRAVYWEPND